MAINLLQLQYRTMKGSLVCYARNILVFTNPWFSRLGAINLLEATLYQQFCRSSTFLVQYVLDISVLPMPLTFAWVTTKLYEKEADSTHCGIGYSLLPSYWILEGPRIACIMVSTGYSKVFWIPLGKQCRKRNLAKIYTKSAEPSEHSVLASFVLKLTQSLIHK